MEKLTAAKYKSLAEAYASVYDENLRQNFNEQAQINEFLEIINTLVEEGYDLSQFTYDELYEDYINDLNEGLASSAWNLLKNPATLRRLGLAAVANWADEQFLKGQGKRLLGNIVNTNLQTLQGKGAKPESSDTARPSRDSSSGNPLGLNQSFDPFDLIKGHLLGEGYADTEEAALAIMANMSEEWRQSIVEQSAIAARTSAAVKNQQDGYYGDDHALDQLQRAAEGSVRKLNRRGGPVVTPGLPGV